MSTPPPIEWFPGINFNVAFYTAGGEYATIDYCNQNFLKSVGYAVSRALSTTFNNIVYFNGGFQVIGDITATGTIYANDANITNTILCTNVSASSISATNFTGSGAGLTNIDGSVIKTGIVEVNVGGTGKNTLTTTQILVGNNTDPIIQSSNLTWDNSNDIFTASNVAGNGSRLSNLNASNVSDGTLAVTRGGTGASNFTAGRLLIGNDTSAITNNGNLTWNGTTNTLNVTGTGTATTLSATNIGIGITNPTSSLEIIKTTTAATSDLIMMKRDDKNHLRISQIYIGINDIKQIFYQMNNNVEDPVLTFYKNSIGIGTTAPGLFKLDVGGTARASILTTPNSVGIGITNPTTTSLHIVNTVNTFKDVIAMNYNDINGLKIQQAYEGVNDIKYTFYEKRNNAEVDTITIYKGAVGIGTTTPATFADLDVIGTTRSTTLTTNGIGIGITDPTTNLLDIVSPVTTSNDLINLRYDNSNGLKIQQNYVAVNDFKQSFIQRNSGVNTNILTFYKGNIGIGTTTPALSDKLSITGNTKITGTATIDTNLIVGGSAGIVGTSQFTGNMGIGTTASSDANTKLVVSGDINIIGNNRYRIGGNAIGNWLAGTDTTKIYYNVGNVGIGTTDPQQKLDIRGINPTIKLLDTGADGNAIIQFRELNDLYGMDIAYIGNLDNKMYIRSYNNSATPINNVTIDRGSGNVGIGTTQPTSKLHINYSTTTGDPSQGGLYVYNSTNSAGQNSYITNRIGGSAANKCLYSLDVAGAYGYSMLMRGNSHSLRFNNNWAGDGTDVMILDNNGFATIGYITQGAFPAGIKFNVYGSDNNGVSAQFKHPNDSQGIGIRYDGLSGMNTNQSMIFRVTGSGQVATYINGTERLNVNGGGVSVNTDLYVVNQIYGGFYAVSTTNTDYLVVQQNYNSGQFASNFIKVGFGTFTGFHRCYTDDELYNNESEENIDLFKNNYMGRVVIATGKIKTDFSRKKETEAEPEPEPEPEIDSITGLPIEPAKLPKDKEDEWYIGIDKDGISVEDAVPVIALSRKKKDKRVFGVLGEPKRSTNNKDRLIVNSVGEGAICVSNTNGNIENGDYIQSSDLLGYGEKQDDDLLHNYTIAKSTIDCNFELDSPYYQCHEIENGVRVAFIACSYHCG